MVVMKSDSFTTCEFYRKEQRNREPSEVKVAILVVVKGDNPKDIV